MVNVPLTITGNAPEKMQGVSKSIKGVTKSFGGLVTGLNQGLELFQRVGGAALRTAEEVFELSGKSANLRTGLEGLAGGGAQAEAMLEAVRTATRGTVDDMTAMEVANSALSFGIVENADQMRELAEIGTVLGNSLGIDATKSVSDLTLALARGSPMILDNLGISLKLSDAYKGYAGQLGKTVEQLTETEKKHAFMSEALRIGGEKVKELGGFVETSATKWQALGVQFTNAKTEGAELVSKALEPMLENMLKQIEEGPKFKDVVSGIGGMFGEVGDAGRSVFDRLGSATDNFGGTLKDLGVGLGLSVETVDDLGDAVSTATDAVKKFKREQGGAAATVALFSGAADGFKLAADEARVAREETEKLATAAESSGEELGGLARQVTADQMQMADALGVSVEVIKAQDAETRRVANSARDAAGGMNELADATSMVSAGFDGVEGATLDSINAWNTAEFAKYEDNLKGATESGISDGIADGASDPESMAVVEELFGQAFSTAIGRGGAAGDILGRSADDLSQREQRRLEDLVKENATGGIASFLNGILGAIEAGDMAGLASAAQGERSNLANAGKMKNAQGAKKAAGERLDILRELLDLFGLSDLIPGFKRGAIFNAGAGSMAQLHGQEAIIPLDEGGDRIQRVVLGGMGETLGEVRDELKRLNTNTDKANEARRTLIGVTLAATRGGSVDAERAALNASELAEIHDSALTLFRGSALDAVQR